MQNSAERKKTAAEVAADPRAPHHDRARQEDEDGQSAPPRGARDAAREPEAGEADRRPHDHLGELEEVVVRALQICRVDSARSYGVVGHLALELKRALHDVVDLGGEVDHADLDEDPYEHGAHVLDDVVDEAQAPLTPGEAVDADLSEDAHPAFTWR